MCNSCGCRDAESFEAQIGYQGARDFVSTMKGRIEGANKEGYFPADEEDFQEFVLDTMEDHIDLADWMERHGAEEEGMSLKESAKVGFGLGAGLLGFRIVAITGAVALGALLSRR